MGTTRAAVIAAIVAILIVAAIAVPGFFSSRRASNERNASASLKTIASAEAEFRGHDRDGNGIQDFWTGDVKALHYLTPPGTSGPIRLIERTLADADADATRPNMNARAGFVYEAMDRDVDGSDYRQGPGKNRHRTRFGFFARPIGRSTGRNVFYINEGNTIFKEPIEAPLRRQWPPDEELRLEYSQRDW